MTKVPVERLSTGFMVQNPRGLPGLPASGWL
jgi:hypothetical protein